ncbi:hypothetical protein MTO96_026649 [Rhipicephalus appendiculatus]
MTLVRKRITCPPSDSDSTEVSDEDDDDCASYAFCRKTMKWWRKLFFWILEVSIVNSFILRCIQLQIHGQHEQRHLQYRRNLIQQLVGDVPVVDEAPADSEVVAAYDTEESGSTATDDPETSVVDVKDLGEMVAIADTIMAAAPPSVQLENTSASCPNYLLKLNEDIACLTNRVATL